MAKIDEYLKIALASRASDIHFVSDELVRARIDGDLSTISSDPLSAQEVENLFSELLDESERARFKKEKNLDKSYALNGVGFFRINIFMARKGPSAVFRTIPQKIPMASELGLPQAVLNFAELPKGLVLVTGPTGSGKSTTLAALIHHINENFPYHILTIEDPIEFVHPSRKSLVNQREIGANCHSFSDALKYALREDPDVILVGEMRDLETIGLALTAAETGHLVFGTLHTRGAASSVDRIIDSFPANQQAMVRTMLAESLVGVVSQSLLKRADGKGRVAAYEILVTNHAISNLIREGKTFQISSVMQTARKDGMVRMDQYILDLVQGKVVTPEEAITYLEEPILLQGKMKQLGKDQAAAVPTARPSPPTPSMQINNSTPRPVTAAPPNPMPKPMPIPQKPMATAAPMTPPPTIMEPVRIIPPSINTLKSPAPPPPHTSTAPPPAQPKMPPPAPTVASPLSAPQKVILFPTPTATTNKTDKPVIENLTVNDMLDENTKIRTLATLQTPTEKTDKTEEVLLWEPSANES